MLRIQEVVLVSLNITPRDVRHAVDR